MTKIVITASLVVIALSTPAMAASLTVANTFQSGTPAVAAEVNQNFTDVETAVNDNDSRISTNTNNILLNANAIGNNTTAISAIRPGLSVYDNGLRVGALVSLDSAFGQQIILMSDTGYLENQQVSIYQTPYFTTMDCTGQAYVVAARKGSLGTPVVKLGLVETTNNTGTYKKVYSTPDATYLPVDLQSYLNGDICTSQALTSYDAKMVYPNDQAITGVPDSYSGPLSIGY